MIAVFSGTTEGRILSEALSKNKIEHYVCVVSDYARQIMKMSEYVRVNIGRLDKEELAYFIDNKNIDVVVDATHPYAKEITAALSELCTAKAIKYIRYTRKIGSTGICGYNVGKHTDSRSLDDKNIDSDNNIQYYSDLSQLKAALENTSGNIMLTTGSKNLKEFCETTSIRERIYARVIPSIESLQICADAGLCGKQIVALQGPFDVELNEALIKQYDIKHLVTKDGGKAGGFEEKLIAAQEMGIAAYVLTCPIEGNSAENAAKSKVLDPKFSEITGLEESTLDKVYDLDVVLERLGCRPKFDNKIKLSLIGIGPGSRDYLTIRADKAIKSSDVIFGAKRMLESLEQADIKQTADKDYDTFSFYRAKDIIPILEKGKYRNASVLFSGDTGFYSGTAEFYEECSKWAKEKDIDLQIEIIPGISAHSYFAAQLGKKYSETSLLSVHGDNSRLAICAVVEKIKSEKFAYVLLSNAGDMRLIAEELELSGLHETKLWLGSRLSYDNQQIKQFTVEEAISYEGNELAILYVEMPNIGNINKYLTDDEFIRDKVPMTKAEIRQLSIIKMGIEASSVVYDIGSGTGSVSVQISKLYPYSRIYAIEKNPEAVLLTQKNIQKFGCNNIELVEGSAPEALKNLPAPDCVFIGGANGQIKEIISSLSRNKRDIRYVINAVSLETIAEVTKLLSELEIVNREVVQIGISREKTLGSHHMLLSENSVMIFSFTVC